MNNPKPRDDDGIEHSVGDAIDIFRLMQDNAPDAVPAAASSAVPTAADYAATCIERQQRYQVPPAYVGALVTDFRRADIDPSCDAAWLWQRPMCVARDVFISGGNGGGKTHMAAALSGEWGLTWRVASDVLRKVRASYNGGDETEDMIVSDLQRRRVLLIDDISAIAKTEHGVSLLLAILAGRIDWQRPTVVTSYLGLRALDGIDSSIASRLASFAQMRLVCSDRRLR